MPVQRRTDVRYEVSTRQIDAELWRWFSLYRRRHVVCCGHQRRRTFIFAGDHHKHQTERNSHFLHVQRALLEKRRCITVPVLAFFIRSTRTAVVAGRFLYRNIRKCIFRRNSMYSIHRMLTWKRSTDKRRQWWELRIGTLSTATSVTEINPDDEHSSSRASVTDRTASALAQPGVVSWSVAATTHYWRRDDCSVTRRVVQLSAGESAIDDGPQHAAPRRSSDVSYTSFDSQKNDSYNGRETK